MKRLRLSTLMLLVVIVAQGVALVAGQVRHRRREAELQARIAADRAEAALEYYRLSKRYKRLQAGLDRQAHQQATAGGAASEGR